MASSGRHDIVKIKAMMTSIWMEIMTTTDMIEIVTMQMA